MNRRDFLRNIIAGGAAAAILDTNSTNIEAAENRFNFVESTLTPEELENQKILAVKSLEQSIPNDSKLDYLRNYVQHLSSESQMYIPTPQELRGVLAKCTRQLNELAQHLDIGSYGLFLFSDATGHEHHSQRMYVLHKNTANEIQFVKAYRVSMAKKGFGNAKDSSQTPLGLHNIHSGKQGMFGEIVSGMNKHRDLFNHVRYENKDHWFVREFAGENGNDVAEVVTDQYLLIGSETDVARGIRIHGTNRSGKVGPDGTWESFLGGQRRSGGCIRMSNTDIRDLALSGYVSDQVAKKPGTPVMIYATEEAKVVSEQDSFNFDKWFYGKKKK